MFNGKNVIAYLISIAAILGPLSYIFFAFFESGRLGYYGAPSEFMQISSFGIRPVIDAIYPAVFITLLISGFVMGVKIEKGKRKLIMVGAVAAYSCLALCYVSLTTKWQLIFGISAVICVLASFSIQNHVPDVGNELVEADPLPVSPSIYFFNSMKKAVAFLGILTVITMVWSAAGRKEAATQEFYWVIDRKSVV